MLDRIKRVFGLGKEEPPPRRIVPLLHKRMYANARQSRLAPGWGQSNTSADHELQTSLTVLRSAARALVRDAGYAKRARTIVVNNVIGCGIGMQGQVKTGEGKLNSRVNDNIEDEWNEWCHAENCHTGGQLHFADLERVAMGTVFEAGEVIIRKHYRKFGKSRVPLALEIIEPERLADTVQPSAVDLMNVVIMGIEVDRYHRPVAYWLRERHPGELHINRFVGSERFERVPADQIIHLRVINRWPQTRGEPWLHAVARRLNDMEGYSHAEIVAARGAAAYMATIESPNADTDDGFGEEQEDGSIEVELEPGIVEKLPPGYKLNFHSPNRPNTAMDPFMRYMLREVAAGVGVSYESLSRDYSQSNYSSSRLALLDDRDLWKVLQAWFIRAFREPLHREWIQQAVLARALESITVDSYAQNPRKFEKVRFKPRGWGWIDPTKEVKAYKEAVKGGFTTVTDVIAATAGGADIEDVLDTRRQELDLMKEKNLKFDTEFIEPTEEKPIDDGDGDVGTGNGNNQAGDDGNRNLRVVVGRRGMQDE